MRKVCKRKLCLINVIFSLTDSDIVELEHVEQMIQLRLSQEIQEEFNPILWTFSKIT